MPAMLFEADQQFPERTSSDGRQGRTTILLVPERLGPSRHAAVEGGLHPRRDFDLLADAIQRMGGSDVEILDYVTVDRSTHPAVRAATWLAGYEWGLATLGFLRRGSVDAILSHAENIGRPYALISKAMRQGRRPCHVVFGIDLAGRRNWLWFRLLRIDRQVDMLLVVSEQQFAIGQRLFGPASPKIRGFRQFGFLDVEFFARAAGASGAGDQVCSVGVEYRDYGTLIRAASGLPTLTLTIDPSSPWSSQEARFGGVDLPANVRISPRELGTVRDLYAECGIVAIPLLPNRVGAGLTTALEAMAAGRAVIMTRVPGARYTVGEEFVDGREMLTVPVGDVEGWRRGLERLVSDRALRERLAGNARRWIERNASTLAWCEQVMDALAGPRQP